MYYDGKGVEKNMAQALMWHYISIENGSDDAKLNWDTLEKEATPEQIFEAKKLSDEWMKKNCLR
jgi:TPR repeat protein